MQDAFTHQDAQTLMTRSNMSQIVSDVKKQRRLNSDQFQNINLKPTHTRLPYIYTPALLLWRFPIFFNGGCGRSSGPRDEKLV